VRKRHKEWIRKIRYTGGRLGFTFYFLVMELIPERLVRPLGRIMGSLAYGVSSRHRERVKENFKIAYGVDLSPKDMARTAHKVFQNLGMVMTELISFARTYRNLQPLIGRIPIDGKQHLDRALARGKGVIALGAHLNNFFLIGSRLAAEGYPFSVIQKYPRNPWFAKKMKGYSKRIGQNPIAFEPRAESVKRSLRCLRKNEILYLMADRPQRGANVSVRFFGKPVLTATGPAVLSLRTGAQIIPIFMIRQDDGGNRLLISPPITPPPTGDRQKHILDLTQACTDVIEEQIRLHPEQWTWLSKRWKARE
jgi:KDO2-lipid IV(A) lauroyltransferase